MRTLKDVASACGVDVSTVSKVLGGAEIRVTPETRAKIEQAAQDLGYRPNSLARSLRKGRSNAVAFSIRSTSSYVYPELIEGVQAGCNHYQMILFLVRYSVADAGREMIRIVQEGRVDGLLFDELPYEDFIVDLNQAKVPYVALNQYEDADWRSVVLDDAEGFRIQAEYLLGLGHENVAFVGVVPRSTVAQLSIDAFQGPFQSRGLNVHLFDCDFEGQAAEELADQILSLDVKPTAIATASLLTAIHLSQSLQARGISVPSEMSIIGYHDAMIATTCRPPMTTVKMPTYKHGMAAAKRLAFLIHGRTMTAPRLISSPIELIERGSCQALKP